MITPTTQVRLCFIVHALDPILSPYGYTAATFTPEQLRLISYTVDDKQLLCQLNSKILYRSLDKWIAKLMPEHEGNLSFYYITPDGVSHTVER